jgi:hypothetical protein
LCFALKGGEEVKGLLHTRGRKKKYQSMKFAALLRLSVELL